MNLLNIKNTISDTYIALLEVTNFSIFQLIKTHAVIFVATQYLMHTVETYVWGAGFYNPLDALLVAFIITSLIYSGIKLYPFLKIKDQLQDIPVKPPAGLTTSKNHSFK